MQEIAKSIELLTYAVTGIIFFLTVTYIRLDRAEKTITKLKSIVDQKEERYE